MHLTLVESILQHSQTLMQSPGNFGKVHFLFSRSGVGSEVLQLLKSDWMMPMQLVFGSHTEYQVTFMP